MQLDAPSPHSVAHAFLVVRILGLKMLLKM